ncbi:hypothetical protein [Hyalangium sp.]|uniref:hypothetical protein n=1 Tax=Hyalangium sp. TaxID=2028555 RepID=UPI002D6271C4|nr:hypothetical protein [Hyalangium sp.]HYH96172.1 hypothetical protein [Hyalangium sp.]
MSGALKAGSVYVSVSAAIGEFTQSMGQIIKSVENTAKRVKEAAKGIAEVGAVFAAAMGGAVLAAAQSNRAMQRDLEHLKGYLYTLAADLGDAFGPFLRELTAAVGSVVGAFQRLSPEVKAAVAQFVVLGAGVGAGAAVLSKAAGLVEGVAKAAGLVLVPALNGASVAAKGLGAASASTFPALGKAVAGMEAGVSQSLAKMALSFAGVLIPIAAVAAAVAGIVLLAGTLYEAWNDSSTGMKAAVLSAWESIKDLGKKLADTLGGWWTTLKGFLLEGLKTLLDVVAGVARKIGGVMAPLARGLGLDRLASVYEDLQQLTGDRILRDLQSGASFLADKVTEAATTLANGAVSVGKEVAEGVSYGLAYSTKGLKRLAKDTGLEDLPGRLKAALSGVLAGPAGQVRKPFEDVDVSTVGKGPGLGASAREFQSGMSSAVRARLDYLKEQAKQLADSAADAMRAARESLAQRFAGAFGDLSALFSTFQQGMAAGGPAGGLIAVIADLLTRSQQFAVLVETLSGLIGMVADWLGKLVEPFIPLVGAIAHLIEAGLQALTPVLQSLSAFVEPLVPSIMVLGELLAGLAPVIALVVQALMVVLNPLQLFAGPALKALFSVLKTVSTIILTVMKALGDVWNGIVGAIQKVFRMLADISVFGVKPLGFLDGWADGLQKAKVDTEAMARALQSLTGMTYEAALEKAKETAEVIRNRQATEKATQALTNVPSAFKYALASFSAQDPQGPGTMPVPSAPPPPSGGGTWDSGTPSPWGGTGVTAPGQTPGGVGSGPAIDTVNITTTSVPEAMEKLEKLMDRLGFARTGSRGRPGRYAVE